MKYLFSLLFLFVVNICVAGNSQSFDLANNAYYDKDYKLSISEYEKIINSGSLSPEVFFNLGNAYFQSNNIGRSVLNFERAKMLNPSSKDITQNLEFVKNFVEIKSQETLIQKRLKELSYNTWVVILSFAIISFICVVGFSKYYFWNISIRNGLLVLSMLILVVSSAGTNTTLKDFKKYIVLSKCDIRSAPMYNADVVESLEGGTDCYFITEHGNFMRIKFSKNLTGWVLKSDCERVLID